MHIRTSVVGHTDDGSELVNSFVHYSEGTEGQTEAAATSFANTWIASWIQIAVETIAVDRVEFYKRDSGHWVPLDVVPSTSSGLATGEQLPNQVAAVLVAPTNILKVRGRKFIAGLSVSAMNGGRWSSGVMAILADMLATYINTYAGPYNDIYPGLWSTKSNTFFPFTSGYVDSVPGSQRRRKIGVGV